MKSSAKPFLSPGIIGDDIKCFICWKYAKEKDKQTSCVGKEGIKKFTEQAELWSRITIPAEVKEHNYTLVYKRLRELCKDSKILVHLSCRANFRNKISLFQNRYCDQGNPGTVGVFSNSPVKHATRLSVSNVKTLEKKCFICNAVRDVDKNSYNQGGLQRCVQEDTAKKILLRKDVFLGIKAHKLNGAAKRLDILLSGSASDIFAADIFYHQSCYIKFVIKAVVPPSIKDIKGTRSEDVLDLFLYNIKTKIVRDKEANLLHELLNDVRCISEDHELEPPAIDNTKQLKRFIIKHFEDKINFFPSGKYLLVHPIDINPCSYSIATLKGRGLRDADLAKAFGRMIRRKLDERKSEDERWPLTPDELLSKLDSGPLPDLYNTIYYSIHDRRKLNEYGYIETSQTEATKIWSIASDWESLVTKKRSPKQIILGLVLHRITGML